MKCSFCGNEIDDGATFCNVCGAAVTSPAAEELEETPIDATKEAAPAPKKSKTPLILAIVSLALSVFVCMLMVVPLGLQDVIKTLFSTDAGLLLWVPFVVAALALSVTSLTMVKKAAHKKPVLIMSIIGIVLAVGMFFLCGYLWIVYALVAGLGGGIQ